VNNINPESYVSIIGGIVSIAGAIVTTYILIKKIPFDLRHTDSESTNSIAEASESLAKSATVTNEFLRQQISEMIEREKRDHIELEVMRIDLDKLKKIQEAQSIEIAAWQDWAKRLSHQVVSLGGVPVAFKPVKLDPL